MHACLCEPIHERECRRAQGARVFRHGDNDIFLVFGVDLVHLLRGFCGRGCFDLGFGRFLGFAVVHRKARDVLENAHTRRHLALESLFGMEVQNRGAQLVQMRHGILARLQNAIGEFAYFSGVHDAYAVSAQHVGNALGNHRNGNVVIGPQ